MASNTLADKTIKAAIKTAADSGKALTLSDGGGLSLLVKPSGAAWWRLRYWLAGKENRLSVGVYPAVSLADARKRRDDLKTQVAAGVDPSQARKDTKAARDHAERVATLVAAGEPLPGTFEAVARDWLRLVHEPKVSPRYAARSLKQLEADVFPWIGATPAGAVSAPVVLGLLRKVAARDALDTAHRVKQTVGLVMRYAIATGHADRDPTPDLREALATPTKHHFSAILDPKRAGELLRAVDGYTGQPGTRAALQLAALTFQRPGNLRAMQWAHLDLDGALWSIPAAEMKRTKQDKETGAPHLVPLASQAVEILRELQPLTGAGALCFPGQRSRARPISDITLNAALRRIGFGPDEMTAHGFRAMARTLMVEQLSGIDPAWIEAQLAHAKKGPLGAAYDRSQYLPQRRTMMQAWADYLDRLRVGAQVVQIRAA
jgi:integrase